MYSMLDRLDPSASTRHWRYRCYAPEVHPRAYATSIRDTKVSQKILADVLEGLGVGHRDIRHNESTIL